MGGESIEADGRRSSDSLLNKPDSCMDYIIISLDSFPFKRPSSLYGNKYSTFRLITEMRYNFFPSFLYGSFAGTVCPTISNMVLLWDDH